MATVSALMVAAAVGFFAIRRDRHKTACSQVIRVQAFLHECIDEAVMAINAIRVLHGAATADNPTKYVAIIPGFEIKYEMLEFSISMRYANQIHHLMLGCV